MELTINGGCKKLRTDLESLGSFLAYRLMKQRLASTLSVEINLKRNLIKKEGVYGSTDYNWENSKPPKSFIIELDITPSTDIILTTTCHEFVHIWQYATGRLKELYRSPMYRFDGKYFKNNLVYEKLPWEKEAFSMEKKLYNEWVLYECGLEFQNKRS